MPVSSVIVVRYDKDTFTVRRPDAPKKGETVLKYKPRDVADDCIGREHTVEFTEDNDQAQLLHIHRMKIL